MRSRPSWWPSVRVLLCFGFLLAPRAALAGDPPPTGTLKGTVVSDTDGAPVAYANVIVTGTGMATIADEHGRFVLPGIPAGRPTIRIQKLGGAPLVETLDLAPGDTLKRTYRLASPAHDRFLHLRDSLTSHGRWPPTLDPALDARMRETRDVRVFRLDPEHPVHGVPPDPEHRVGPWPIIREAPPPDPMVIAELIETLRHSELYMPNIRGERTLCGGFSPGIAVRFVNFGVPTELLLSYTCGEFSIWSGDGDRARQTGDFAGLAPAFIRFAQRVFPRDPEIRKLGAKRKRPSG